MKSICVGATKGGVGKSTLALNLAIAAVKDKKSVLVIDTDPQGSSMAFRSLRGGSDLKATVIDTPDIHKRMGEFKEFDLVIVDAGGREDQVLTSAIGACDFFLLPVLPGQLEIWGARDAVKIFEAVKQKRPNIQGRIVVNRNLPNTKVSDVSRRYLKDFSLLLPTLKYTITHRVAFINSIEKGKGVVETEPEGKASIEIKWLYSVVEKILDQVEV